jgi:hypothetical protein
MWDEPVRLSRNPAEMARDVPGLVQLGAFEARGTREGVQVSVLWTLVTTKDQWGVERDVGTMRYTGLIDPGLRMGLGLQNENDALDWMLRVEEVGDLHIGVAPLDSSFRVRAFDPDHARRVLSQPSVYEPLVALRRSVPRMAVTDGHIVASDAWEPNASDLGWRLELVHRSVRALMDVRAREPASWEPELGRLWGHVASARGLTYDPIGTRLGGVIHDAHVQLDVVATKNGLGTSAWVRFETPLDVGLYVFAARKRSMLQTLFGGQDVECGHAAFDKAFVVKASRPDVARGILQRGAAEALLALSSVGDVAANDQGVRLYVPRLLADPQAIEHIVDALVRAVLAVDPKGPAQTAYR